MRRQGIGCYCFWRDLDWRIRSVLPIAAFGLSAGLLYFGVVFELGWIAGILLVLFGGRSRSEKHGYRF